MRIHLKTALPAARQPTGTIPVTPAKIKSWVYFCRKSPTFHDLFTELKTGEFVAMQ